MNPHRIRSTLGSKKLENDVGWFLPLLLVGLEDLRSTFLASSVDGTT